MRQASFTHPKTSSAFWSTPASDEKGILSDSMSVWCLGRINHKGRENFEQQLQVLFVDTEGAVE